MAIVFDKTKWDCLGESYGKWWAGELKRPLIHLTMYGADPGRPEPPLPGARFTAHYDSSVAPEAIVDRWDYELSTHRFLGDGFPHVWPNFGAGVIAAFLGADILNKPETCWFKPKQIKPISDISLTYDPSNPWMPRIKEICRAALDRWEGNVQIAMTDLGGNLDIVSTFRPGEALLTDLYDFPDEVRRLAWEAHKAWWQCFEEINGVLQPANPGFSAWAPIFSSAPYYMLQCDFCYMIGPDMFDEFVKPELAASCRKLANPFYHLDGVGQLPHLDSLLSIKELKGVQWIPGDGKPPMVEWPEVLRKIRAAGKLIQLYGGLGDLDRAVKHLGSAEGLLIIGGCHVSQEREARELLERYGVPA